MILVKDPLKLDMDYVAAERRDLKEILVHYAGLDLTADVVEQLLEDLSKSMQAKPDVLKRSLSDVFHRRIENCDALAARLAMSAHRIREGIPWASWGAVYSQPEWMYLQPVHILEKADAFEKGKSVYQIVMNVLAGSAGPTRLKFQLSWPLLKVSSQAMGFTTIRKPITMFRNPYDIYGMQFLAKVAPPKDTGKPCRIIELAKPLGKMIKRNRQIIDARARLDFVCPKKYEHACSRCAEGLAGCPVATHKHTYVMALCTVCNKKDWMDPDPQYGSTTVCISCRKLEGVVMRELRKKRK